LEGSDVLTTGRKSRRIRAAGVVCLAILVGTTFCQAVSQVEPTSANPQLNRGLKILYAGRPDSDREKDFVSFLKQYFEVVQTGNLETFQESDTQGFDVTLLDWDRNEFEGPRPKISESFSRPLITLGVPGGMICNEWRLKTGYL
jgi:hypothetical protein